MAQLRQELPAVFIALQKLKVDDDVYSDPQRGGFLALAEHSDEGRQRALEMVSKMQRAWACEASSGDARWRNPSAVLSKTIRSIMDEFHRRRGVPSNTSGRDRAAMEQSRKRRR
ncbi:unnamed protein product [Effrenium voratum]|uniref:Uncharacterized protein n=1 Tax=Effrenium voratum TaxID=2562239 RepID=A0AA36MT78_9DINO|nr:unnamed protein product [Effrenium voratum]